MTCKLVSSKIEVVLSEPEIDLQANPCLIADARRLKLADRVGQQLGNYRLIALLGQGGYAEVYLGQHVRLNLQAAIKVLHTHLTNQEASHFQQEAETIATLMHPSIVRILDFDVQEGVPLLIMDYAPNGSLRRRYPKGNILPLPQIVSYVKQVAAALQYAHERKFIHCDVKPENMLLGRHEEVLLSDFGLAALAHSSGSLSTKEAVGTLPYMAPEQIEGHPRAASDQYALGVVVYEWLCGSRPFEGSATVVMVRQLTMPPPPLHEKVAAITPELEQVVLRALAKDPKQRFPSVQAFATALEQASQLTSAHTIGIASEQPASDLAAAASYATVAVSPGQLGELTEATPSADVPRETLEPTVLPASLAPPDLTTPPNHAATTPAVQPSRSRPTPPIRQRIRRLSRTSAVLLIGLVVVVVAAGLLGSMSLLAHFGVLGTRSGLTTPARGGTWVNETVGDAVSLLPNAPGSVAGWQIEMALYLPLFYGDPQGVFHPAAATEVPTVQNRGISADAKTWTFHLRPHLVWSDGQPYDARDVDYTWRLWLNPSFNPGFVLDSIGLRLISSTDVSADHLSITFHLKRAYVPFLQSWMDGGQAPLPAHHFRAMAPGQITRSPDSLNPQVVSGPFLMAESVPGDHYTVVRNPRYYLASQGLPYLDKVVFRIAANEDAVLKDLQAGTIDSSAFLDASQLSTYQRLQGYTLTTPATSANIQGLLFNFHNTVLASHLEVRQAVAMAIDHRALIQAIPHGLVTPLCTEHGTFYHPGYQPDAPCPIFDAGAANKLLSDNGWVKGPDGVRSKGNERLEFEFSADINRQFQPWSVGDQAIIQRNLQAIGIKLDIQNYSDATFTSLLNEGKASPATGAMAGRYDIAEFETFFGYDPDDSLLLACNQSPPTGQNFDFYCNPTLDALYRQELSIADPGVRQQIFVQIHQIFLSQFPFITLYSPTDLYTVRRGTHSFLPNPVSGEDINIWQWWCDNGKC